LRISRVFVPVPEYTPARSERFTKPDPLSACQLTVAPDPCELIEILTGLPSQTGGNTGCKVMLTFSYRLILAVPVRLGLGAVTMQEFASVMDVML
jgi:hypothetical protein